MEGEYKLFTVRLSTPGMRDDNVVEMTLEFRRVNGNHREYVTLEHRFVIGEKEPVTAAGLERLARDIRTEME